eukprot:XP_765139.1 hypothetical protein [Theileria parva strain Muguga]
MSIVDEINNLLYSSNTHLQHLANENLMKWQRSQEAWNESHSILTSNLPNDRVVGKVYSWSDVAAEDTVRFLSVTS